MSLELWESLKGIMDKFKEHLGKTGETHETIRGNTGKQEDCVALYEIMEHARAGPSGNLGEMINHRKRWQL